MAVLQVAAVNVVDAYFVCLSLASQNLHNTSGHILVEFLAKIWEEMSGSLIKVEMLSHRKSVTNISSVDGKRRGRDSYIGLIF
jgi:hypothetical protein